MSLLAKLKQFATHTLALDITESERLSYADDPLNVFNSELSNERPLRVAAVLALLFHILLALFFVPRFSAEITPVAEVLVLKRLAQPAALRGGSPPEPVAPKPKPKPVTPEPKPVLVPIPDPTPADPEPIRKETLKDVPTVLDEIAAELSIGDITAPPTRGTGRGRAGTGSGPSEGTGPAAGDGSGVYTVGGGVTNPTLIHQTTPSYTDAAIKAKIQGVVLLEAIIRMDGSVSNFRVLRGLGYGLEEKAIQEIATNWKFLPGRLNGQPVNVRATIEVTFNLR